MKRKLTCSSVKTHQHKEAGFGLVELIVVVAILGILVIIAIPVYGAIQATASQKTVDEASRSAYTSIMAVYKTQGRDAAVAQVKKLNAERPEIMYYVRETPVDSSGKMEDGAYPVTRAYFEAAFKSGPNALPMASLRSSLSSDEIILNSNIGSMSEATEGDFLCVGALLGKTYVEYVGWAGLACGPADTSLE